MPWMRFALRLVAFCAIVPVLLPTFVLPLQALKSLHRMQATKHKSTAPTARMRAQDSPPAKPAWTAVIDGEGVTRRLYLSPAPAGQLDTVEQARSLLQTAAGNRQAAIDLRLVSRRHSPAGTHVRFQQYEHDIPVYGAEAVVSFDRRQRPTVVMNDTQELPAALPSKARMPSEVAVLKALHATGHRGEPRTAPEVELYYRWQQGHWRLAQRVTFVGHAPLGDWEVWLSANDAEVWECRDRTLHHRPDDESMARVFLPDAAFASGDKELEDNNDSDSGIPESSYTMVALQGLQAPAGGVYYLRGPHVVLEDWEGPSAAPVTSTTGDFLYHRSQRGFEDVMVYYHIDTMQRWYQELGFTDANNRPQVADAHGFYGFDNSKYVPSLRKLSFGEGGVDDAEDGGVIIHEYGHATQHDLVPTWGSGGHTLAMGEGFGDYLANSYAYARHPQRVQDWNAVFPWDGHNEFWSGRQAIDTSLHYPEDADGAPHYSGTLWCSALTEILYGLGDRRLADQLVLAHHYMLTGNASMEDAANAILATDVSLNEGAHLPFLVQVFQRWGLLSAEDHPAYTMHHTPTDYVTMSDGMPALRVSVHSNLGTSSTPHVVLWTQRDGEADWISTPLEETGEASWEAVPPYPFQSQIDIRYYFEASEPGVDSARLPQNPEEFFTLSTAFRVEDFEEDSGWKTGATDDATSGRWQRAIPVGTLAQPYRDHSGEGQYCWVTANGVPGAGASESDVDGGETTLFSPVYDMRGAFEARLIYWRWFSNDQGSNPGEDFWEAHVSNDAGATWVQLERTTVAETQWVLQEFDLAEKLGELDQIQLRFGVSDRLGSSLVEAALDDVAIQADWTADGPGRRSLLFELGAYPNPFNPNTSVRLTVADAAETRLVVYDVQGRLVRQLWQGTLQSGVHRFGWDGKDQRGRAVPSGLYWLQAASGEYSKSLKMTILR